MVEHQSLLSDELEGYLADEIHTICDNCDSKEAIELMTKLSATRGFRRIQSGHMDDQTESFREFRAFINLTKKEARLDARISSSGVRQSHKSAE